MQEQKLVRLMALWAKIAKECLTRDDAVLYSKLNDIQEL